jgi:MFS family permease
VTGRRLARIFWIGAAATLFAAALVALVAVLRGDFSDNDARILGTLASVLFAGSTAVAGLALVERGGRILGWVAVVAAVPALGALLYAIWEIVFDGDSEAWRWGWLGALTLVAALIAVTSRLLARSPALQRLAYAAGALAGAAAASTVGAIWSEDPDEAYGRAIAVLWILTTLCYLLVPVLQRFSSAGHEASEEERILGELDGVQVVATRSRAGTIEARLEPGERLSLRRA